MGSENSDPPATLYLATAKSFRNAILLSILGTAAFTLAVVDMLSARPIAVLPLIAGGGLCYVALYNWQFARAARLAERIIPSDQRVIFSLGVIAPAWVWRGNALLLVGDGRELVAIGLPLVRAPSPWWRATGSELRNVEATGGRLATLTLTTNEGSVALRMSGIEAAESLAALESMRSAP